MLEILKLSKGKFETLDKPVKGSWINVILPVEEDIERLKSIVDVPKDILSTLMDLEEIPMIERYNGFTFVIIRTPQKTQNNQNLGYFTIPLGIIMSDKYLITICFSKNDVVDKMKTLKFDTNGIEPVLKMLLASSIIYMNYLKEINKKINAIENELEKTTKNKEIMRLLNVEKSLVYFTTSLKSNQILVERLAKNNEIMKIKKNEELIDDILDENKQAIEMSEIYSNILSSMTDTFTSIISNNLNTILKILASITIVLMIPTLIASIYGMNIDLPFQNSPHAFTITMVASIVFSLIGFFVLWRKELF